MPIAHNLKKVAKNVAKSLAAIHVKGRKFKQLNRATQRDEKITAKKAKALQQRTNNQALYYFLQQLINDDEDFAKMETFSLSQLKKMIEMHVSRHDDELEELRLQRRPGRPMTSKHQILEEKVKHDRHLWDTGIKAPDLTDKDTVANLRKWNGTLGGLTVMKHIDVSLKTETDEMEE